MDLKSLISNATKIQSTNSPQKVDGAPKLLSTNESNESNRSICTCGHPKDAHDEDDICEILECECGNFTSILNLTNVTDVTITAPITPIDNEQSEARLHRSSKDVTEVAGANLEGCAHICQPSIANDKGPQGCGLWWSHGPRDKCRHPDLINIGLCPTCLGVGNKPFDPLEDWDNDRLTPQGILKAGNKARKDCKDMNAEQLTAHISMLAKRIETLKAESMMSRKMRSELEEEELSHIPEEERERFIQALRRGGKKAGRKPKVSKPPTPEEVGIRLSKMERHIRNLMATTGKTRQEVEAFLDD